MNPDAGGVVGERRGRLELYEELLFRFLGLLFIPRHLSHHRHALLRRRLEKRFLMQLAAQFVHQLQAFAEFLARFSLERFRERFVEIRDNFRGSGSRRVRVSGNNDLGQLIHHLEFGWGEEEWGRLLCDTLGNPLSHHGHGCHCARCDS